jgi:hypothetical protein
LEDGDASLNIHTTVFPAGEISGFLQSCGCPRALDLGHDNLGFAGVGFMALSPTQKRCDNSLINFQIANQQTAFGRCFC